MIDTDKYESTSNCGYEECNGGHACEDKNAHTLMWISIRVKWSFISNVKMGLNGKKHGHTKGVIGDD